MSKERCRTGATDYVSSYKKTSLGVLDKIPEEEIVELIGLLGEARDAERQVFLCGNGGSAATASHLASELGKEASLEQSKRFRILSLTDNVSWITALANDLAYDQVFVQQLRNYARADDLLVAFSGSGNSSNVLEAVAWGNENGLVTVGITGQPGGKLAELARHPVLVESDHMGHIQEGHFLIQHLLSYYFIEADRS
jgi:D-sedoheptulose 7-phosphate isomerase